MTGWSNEPKPHRYKAIAEQWLKEHGEWDENTAVETLPCGICRRYYDAHIDPIPPEVELQSLNAARLPGF